jgi:Uncharacterized conserved protein
LLHLGPQQGEEYDLADGRAVCKQHHQPVYAHALSGRRGHDLELFTANVKAKLNRYASQLVQVCNEVGDKYGIPVVNKRISVSPIAVVGAPFGPDGMRRMVESIRHLLGESEHKTKAAQQATEEAEKATARAEEAALKAENAKREGMQTLPKLPPTG